MAAHSMPTITPSSDLGDLGESLVKKLMPPLWVVRRQSPDIHVDFRVEVVEEGEPTARHVALQVKSARRTPRRVSMKRKHLEYYADPCREPVFIIAMNTVDEDAHYVFAQQWLDANSHWKHQGSTGVPINPQGPRLSDTAAFSLAVAEAFAYMRRTRRQPLPLSIQDEERELQALDPRFRVSMSVNRSGSYVQLEAMQQVSGKLSMTVPVLDGVDIESRYRAAQDFGEPFVAEQATVAFEGSDLLASIFGRGPGTFIFEQKPQGVTIHFRSTTVPARSLTMVGEITRGRVGGSVSVSYAGGLFKLSGRVSASSDDRGHASLVFELGLDRLHGLDLTEMDGIANLRWFVGAIACGEPTDAHISLDDGRAGSSKFRPEGNALIPKDWMFALDVLDALRLLGKRGAMSISCPDFTSTTLEECFAIDIAGTLLRDGRVELKPSPVRIRMEPRDDALKAVQTMKLEDPGIWFMRTTLTIQWKGADLATVPVVRRFAQYVARVEDGDSLSIVLEPTERSTNVLEIDEGQASTAFDGSPAT